MPAVHKNVKRPTLDDIASMNKEMLDAKDICKFLGVDQYYINLQAQADPSKLGFPVAVFNRRVKIPRDGFVHWARGMFAGGANECS